MGSKGAVTCWSKFPSLTDSVLHAARAAINQVLTGHESNPEFAVDHHWTLVAANRAVAPLLAGIGAGLTERARESSPLL